MQIAYRAQDITEAHIVAGMLRAKGIDAYVSGHYLQGAMGEIGAAGFTNVLVEDDDLFQAQVLTQEYEGEPHAVTDGASADTRIETYALGFLLVAVAIAMLFSLWT